MEGLLAVLLEQAALLQVLAPNAVPRPRDRVEAPLLLEGGRHHATDWETALDRLAQLTRGGGGSAVVLASGRASLEALGWVRRMLARFEVTGAVRVPLGAEAPLAGVPGLALRAERAPNVHGARALALIRSRSYTLPQDVRDLAKDVLRHRLVLTYEALAEGVTADTVLDAVVAAVPLPQIDLGREAA